MACSVRCYSIGEGEYEQHFMPRLIIGDNVSLSKYVHNFPPLYHSGKLGTNENNDGLLWK